MRRKEEEEEEEEDEEKILKEFLKKIHDRKHMTSGVLCLLEKTLNSWPCVFIFHLSISKQNLCYCVKLKVLR